MINKITIEDPSVFELARVLSFMDQDNNVKIQGIKSITIESDPKKHTTIIRDTTVSKSAASKQRPSKSEIGFKA